MALGPMELAQMNTTIGGNIGKDMTIRQDQTVKDTPKSNSSKLLEQVLPSPGGTVSKEMKPSGTSGSDTASTSFVGRSRSNAISQPQTLKTETVSTPPKTEDTGSTQETRKPQQPEVKLTFNTQVKQLAEQRGDLTELMGQSGLGKVSEQGAKIRDVVSLQIQFNTKLCDTLDQIEGEIAKGGDDGTLKDQRTALLKQAVLANFPTMVVNDKAVTHMAEALGHLRDQVANSGPETKGAVTGGLLRELSQVPGFVDEGGSVTSLKKDARETATALTVIARGGENSLNQLDRAVGREAGVSQLVSELRKQDFLNKAAGAFMLQVLSDDKPAQELMSKVLAGQSDRGDLVSFVAKKMGPTMAGALTERLELAGKVADRLQMMEDQKDRVIRAMGGGEKGAQAVSTTLLAVGQVLDSNTGKVDRSTLSLLNELGKSNKPAGLQIARLAVMVQEVNRDLEVLGMEKQTADFGKGVQINDSFNVSAILSIADIDPTDMISLGYSPEDAMTLHETAGRLGQAGFSNTAQILKSTKDMVANGHKAFSDIGVQDQLHALQMGENGLAIQKFEASIVNKSLDVAHKGGMTTGTDIALNQNNAIRFAMEGLKERLLGAPEHRTTTKQLLDTAANLSRDVYDERSTVKDQMTTLEDRTLESKRLLTERRGTEQGDKPEGLKTAKTLLKVIDTQRQIDALGTDPAHDKERTALEKERNGALKDLKGLDYKTLTTPLFSSKTIAFSNAPPTMEQLAGLFDLNEVEELAKAVVFLREERPAAMKELSRTLNRLDDRQGTGQSGVLSTSSESKVQSSRMSLGEDVLKGATGFIRLAVLKQMDGKSESYDPRPDRDKIEAQLKDWGMDIEMFRPEIDDTLLTTVTNATIRQWDTEARDGTSLSDAIDDPGVFAIAKRKVLELPTTVKTAVAERLTNQRGLDAESRDVLGTMVQKMEPGTSLEFTQGKGGKLTLKGPVDPSGSVKLGGSGAVDILSQIKIERTKDGFSIQNLNMLQGEIGMQLEASQGKDVLDNSIAKVGAKIGGEVHIGGKLGGLRGDRFEVSTPEQMMVFLNAMLDNASVPGVAMEQVNKVERLNGFGGGLSIGASVFAEMKLGVKALGGDGLKAGGKIQGDMGIDVSRETAVSLDGRSVTRTKDTIISLKAEAKIEVNLENLTSLLANKATDNEVGKEIDKTLDKVFTALKMDNTVKDTNGQLKVNSNGELEKKYSAEKLTSGQVESLLGKIPTLEPFNGKIVEMGTREVIQSTYERQGSNDRPHLLNVQRSVGTAADTPELGGAVLSLANGRMMERLQGDPALLRQVMSLVLVANLEPKGRQIIMDFELRPEVREQAATLQDRAFDLRHEADLLQGSGGKPSRETQERVSNLRERAKGLENEATRLTEDKENFDAVGIRLVREQGGSGQSSILDAGALSIAHKFGLKQEENVTELSMR